MAAQVARHIEDRLPPASSLPVADVAPARARDVLAERAVARRQEQAAVARRIADAGMIAGALRTARERPWRVGSVLRRSGLLLPRWYAGVHGLSSPWRSHRHFAEEGIARDLPPNPFFEPGWYRVEHLHPGTVESPIAHYLRIGALNALQPGPLFDPMHYAALNPDLAQEPDLLAHFLHKGIFEDRPFLPEPAAC